MPSNHLILCCPLLLPPSIFPSIRVFSKESVLRIRWPKYWSFSFNISPSNEYPGLISFKMDWLMFRLQKIQTSSSKMLNPELPYASAILFLGKCESASLSHVQLFSTPWTGACQAPLLVEFSREEDSSWLPFPFPGNLPDPGTEPGSQALKADSSPSEPTGKPYF